jgi:hypothetical protein
LYSIYLWTHFCFPLQECQLFVVLIASKSSFYAGIWTSCSLFCIWRYSCAVYVSFAAVILCCSSFVNFFILWAHHWIGAPALFPLSTSFNQSNLKLSIVWILRYTFYSWKFIYIYISVFLLHVSGPGSVLGNKRDMFYFSDRKIKIVLCISTWGKIFPGCLSDLFECFWHVWWDLVI